MIPIASSNGHLLIDTMLAIANRISQPVVDLIFNALFVDCVVVFIAL